MTVCWVYDKVNNLYSLTHMYLEEVRIVEIYFQSLREDEYNNIKGMWQNNKQENYGWLGEIQIIPLQ